MCATQRALKIKEFTDKYYQYTNREDDTAVYKEEKKRSIHI